MHQIQDEGFREIQLSGKQLVFLFMAATVISVAIFLCGVLVGRGVRAERALAAADAANLAVVATPDVTSVAPAPVPAGSDPTAAAPPPAVDDLSFFNRLEKKTPPAEHLKPASESLARQVSPAFSASGREKAPAVKTAPRVEAVAAPPAAQDEAASKSLSEPTPSSDGRAAEPSGQGFALQVTALRQKGQAEAIARRLTAKGYAAYVLAPVAGAPSVYRVRVGKFKTRHEAEAIATKLQKEEQFRPWITR